MQYALIAGNSQIYAALLLTFHIEATVTVSATLMFKYDIQPCHQAPMKAHGGYIHHIARMHVQGQLHRELCCVYRACQVFAMVLLLQYGHYAESDEPTGRCCGTIVLVLCDTSHFISISHWTLVRSGEGRQLVMGHFTIAQLQPGEAGASTCSKPCTAFIHMGHAARHWDGPNAGQHAILHPTATSREQPALAP